MPAFRELVADKGPGPEIDDGSRAADAPHPPRRTPMRLVPLGRERDTSPRALLGNGEFRVERRRRIVSRIDLHALGGVQKTNTLPSAGTRRIGGKAIKGSATGGPPVMSRGAFP